MIKWLITFWNNLMGQRKHGGYYQGEFEPKFPEKCLNIRRNGKKPFGRSSWEFRVFNWLDLNENVIEWGSEVVKIPYIFDIDQKLHNYFPDIIARIKDKDGIPHTYLLEIKPEKQTTPPKVPQRKTKKAMKNYDYARYHYIMNKNKWRSARQYCEGKEWKFRLVTEKNLF